MDEIISQNYNEPKTRIPLSYITEELMDNEEFVDAFLHTTWDGDFGLESHILSLLIEVRTKTINECISMIDPYSEVGWQDALKEQYLKLPKDSIIV